MSPSARAQLCVVGAACLWGSTGTAQELGPDGASPLAVGAVRIVTGALGLVVVAAVRGRLPGRDLLARPPAWVAGAAMAAYQLCLFSGVRRTGVALGTVVGIGSTPVWAGLLGWLIRRERPGAAWAAGTAIAVAGCVLLVGRGDAEADALGIALTLAAGFTYASYATAVKGLLDEHPSDLVVTLSFVIGAVLLVPALGAGDAAPLLTFGGLTLALWLGLVSVTVAYLLFGAGIAGVTVATAATLTLAEPVTAAGLGIAVLDEPFTAGVVGGAALVLAGLVVSAQSNPRRRRSSDP